MIATSVTANLVTFATYHIVEFVVTPVAAVNRKLTTGTVNSEKLLGRIDMDAADANNLRRHAIHRETFSSAVSVRFTVEVARSHGYSYKEMSSSLRDSVSKGQVTFNLVFYAGQSHLPNDLSVSTVGFRTEDASVNPDPESSSDEKKPFLTIPAIVGIVIGGMCAIFLLVCWATRGAVLFALYRCLCPCRSSVEPQDPMQGESCW